MLVTEQGRGTLREWHTVCIAEQGCGTQHMSNRAGAWHIITTE